MDDQAHRLTSNLNALLDARGVSRLQLAQRSGVSRSNVYRLCSGQGMVGVDKLEKIAQFLGVTVDVLLGTKPVLFTAMASAANERHLSRERQSSAQVAKQVGRLVEDFLSCAPDDQRKIAALATRLASRK